MGIVAFLSRQGIASDSRGDSPPVPYVCTCIGAKNASEGRCASETAARKYRDLAQSLAIFGNARARERRTTADAIADQLELNAHACRKRWRDIADRAEWIPATDDGNGPGD